MSTIGRVDDRGGRRGLPIAGTRKSGHFSGAPPGPAEGAREPAAVAVDLGSGYTRIWASGRPLLQIPTLSDSLTDPTRPVRRGEVADLGDLRTLLAGLLRRHHRPLPEGAVVVACRPVRAAESDAATVQRLLTEVLPRPRVLFIDTVRAAAIGAGVAPGPTFVADVGAQVTEVAVLARGAVAAARRADLGMRDLIRPTNPEVLVSVVTDLVDELRREPRCRADAAIAARRGLLLVGGGATRPELVAGCAAALGIAVRPANEPRVVAVRGAGLAALAALRRTASSGA